MIGSTRQLTVWALAAPCDMRKSFDTLHSLVTNQLQKDLLAGDLFLFVGRDRKRAKVLFWDGTGVCIYMKRLAKGRFTAPWRAGSDGAPLRMTQSELALLLEGCELAGKIPLSPTPFSFAQKSSRDAELSAARNR